MAPCPFPGKSGAVGDESGAQGRADLFHQRDANTIAPLVTRQGEGAICRQGHGPADAGNADWAQGAGASPASAPPPSLAAPDGPASPRLGACSARSNRQAACRLRSSSSVSWSSRGSSLTRWRLPHLEWLHATGSRIARTVRANFRRRALDITGQEGTVVRN